MDTDRLAALVATLDHPDKPTLRRAVDELIACAGDTLQIRDVLEHRLGEPDHRNYWPVAYVLGHLGEPSGPTIRTLMLALDHREPDIRWACALLLMKIAQSEPTVIYLLIDLCRGGTSNQKRMALYCLRDMKLMDAASLQVMLAALSDADSTVRVAAAISLKTRSSSEDLVRTELLKSYVNDADSKVRSAAAMTLAHFGSPSAAFVTELKKNLENDNSQIRKSAALALQWLEKK
jgi:hypothetical protein